MVNPYETMPLNILESRSIITSGITIYCGLYFMTDTLDEWGKLAFFAMIVFANTYFLSYWIYRMTEAMLVKFAKKKPGCIKKCCKCWPAVS